jgi:hypothetical protein
MSPSVDTYLDSYLVKTDFDGNAEWNMTYVIPLESHELTSFVEDLMAVTYCWGTLTTT